MLKKMFTKKLILIMAVTFSLTLVCLIPNDSSKLNAKQELKYVDKEVAKSVAYLLDSNNYLARTMVVTSNAKIEEKARELMEILIKDGKGESKIPNGFRSLISSETKINSVHYNDGLIKVDFSSELLDTNIEQEEKIIEAIVYTLTSIENVDKVIIYVDGDILTKLPKTGITLPSTLDKSYGINKEYDISSYKDINKVTVYYVSKYNDNTYYVPVTKYLNDEREKIKIIVDELASSYLYNSNLMSYLNSNTTLLSSEITDDTLSLVFNQYIFSDQTTKNILEEVIYTIGLSIGVNYDVKQVVFNVDNQEIYKSVIKTLENS
jgi:spore germination protein gerM